MGGDVMSDLASMDDFVVVAGSVLEDLRSRVGLDAWFVSRRDGDDDVVLAVVDEVFGISAGNVYSWADSYGAQTVEAHAPLAAGDVGQVAAYAQARSRNGIAAAACLNVPVPAPDGERLAFLCGLGRRPQDQLPDRVATVQVQAKLLGVLLAHELHLAQEVRRAERAESAGGAHVDPLTRLGDRRAWDNALRAEEARAARYATSVAVIIVNLDGLRETNADGGHEAGDQLLIRAAALLRDRIRGVDVLARVSGDEFGIILPDTVSAGAQAIIADLRVLLARAGIAASLGTGQRRSDTGLGGAWRTADLAMQADKLHAGQRLIDVHSLTGTATGPAGRTGPAELPRPGGNRLSSVDALLHLAKDQLDMDVAFLNVFEGDDRRFRNLVSSVDLPFGAGFTSPREGSYCQMIVDGTLDEVIVDASLDPRVRDLPVTRALGIGSYIGVPLRRRDGTLYGTLCTYSLQPDPTLRERDTGVLTAIGAIMMDLVETEDHTENRKHQVLDRLDALYAANGPDIVYQPIQTLNRLETIGVEALSRFPHGSQNPDEWFTSAAAAGVGPTLELAALRNAVTVLPHLNGFLALNVSPLALASPAFTRFITEQPLHRIVLEITEHEAIDDYSSLREALKPLRRQGMRVSIDDAGAGFASMRHILALVPDFIKLDISLVRNIDTDPPRQALAAALATFAAKTGAVVIAEGIETAEELDCLRGLGIDCGQGYHLSRPAPIPFPRRPRP